jgi:hypothetical protein
MNADKNSKSAIISQISVISVLFAPEAQLLDEDAEWGTKLLS